MTQHQLQYEAVQAKKHHHRSDRVDVRVEDDRTGMSVETFKRAIADNLYYIQGKNEAIATAHDYYMALSYSVRDRLMHRWLKSIDTYFQGNEKVVCYLSAEFLMGRQLVNNLINVGCFETAREALKQSGLDLYDLIEQEPDPGLGNGGLGRLAACFLDSLATLELPAIGYGIRYDFGIFEQVIRDGWQVERPDEWLALGNPWEIHRAERMVEVKLGGRTEAYKDENGNLRMRWIPEHTVMGTPYDTLVAGYNTNTVNTLRLWSAKASREFDFQIFNEGDYTRAVEAKTFSENISKVLYPNDNNPQGKELRLKQQYFFVTCSLQDIIRLHLMRNEDLTELPNCAAVQLNDTHPAIAVAELMRLLVDEHMLSWEKAWDITKNTLAFTNHTLLPEALERWSVGLFRHLLPRHLEIIFEINRRFVDEMRVEYPNDPERVARLSLIEEGHDKKVRMANLACVGSFAINGVAELHTELLKAHVLNDFHQLWPDKISAKTNGVTPRRWMLASNPKLSLLITEKIGKDWIKDLDQLRNLETFAKDAAFCKRWREVKRENKEDLAEIIQQLKGVEVNPDSIFDIQVKRIHEYKRQLLMVLYVIAEYHRIKKNPKEQIVPRTCIIAGKAAPGYYMAKLIIKLVNSVAEVVNNDADIAGRLKLVFLPNFSVSLGERVYPACDLSEQISMAGKEASGTGNMKFSMNGALTIGTLDGANVEIREEVGEENFFLFGLSVEEVQKKKREGYAPWVYYESNSQLKEVIDSIASGHFCPDNPGLFEPIVSSLLGHDTYLLMADFQAYVECQKRVSAAYLKEKEWTKMSILNVSRMGKFSSDRTMKEYAKEIWAVKPVKVEIDEYDQPKAGLQVEVMGKGESRSVKKKTKAKK